MSAAAALAPFGALEQIDGAVRLENVAPARAPGSDGPSVDPTTLVRRVG
jgi:hypothetical protein